MQEQAMAYFNCSTLRGVEVENQGGPGTAMSHWERRLLGVIYFATHSYLSGIIWSMVYCSLQNEGMTGFAIAVFKRPISKITFGLLQDSGYDVTTQLPQLLIYFMHV